jgi:hypothetical protein
MFGESSSDATTHAAHRTADTKRSSRSSTVTLLMCALVLLVGYIISDAHHRTFRITTEGKQLIVERGMFLPFGYGAYEPTGEDLKEAYQPVDLPRDNLKISEVFDDQLALDRGLFALLSEWVRNEVDATDSDAKALRLAGYLRRCKLLPGLSLQQRQDVQLLEGDVSYQNGKRIVYGIMKELELALREFERASEYGTTKNSSDIGHWVSDLHELIQLNRKSSAAKLGSAAGHVPTLPEAAAPAAAPSVLPSAPQTTLPAPSPAKDTSQQAAPATAS